MGSSFEWKNFGAIEGLVVSIPDGDDGGVIELRGDNGAGKSTVVKSLQALSGDLDSKLFDETPRDGQSAGSLRAPGVVVNIFARKTTFDPKGGRVAARIINGAPLAMLIDPKLKGDKTRSEARNRALAQLVDLKLTDAAMELLSKGEAALKLMVPRDANLLDGADAIREKAIELAQEASQNAKIAGDEAQRHAESATEIECKIREMASGEMPEQIPSVDDAKKAHEAMVRTAEGMRISNGTLKDLMAQREEFAPLRLPVRPDVAPVDAQIDELVSNAMTQGGQLSTLEARRSHLLGRNEENRRKQEINDRLISDLAAKLAAARITEEQLDKEAEEITDALTSSDLNPAALQEQRDTLNGMQARKEELKRDRARIQVEAERWDRIEAIFEKPIDGYASDEDVYSAEMDIDVSSNQLELAQLNEQRLELLRKQKTVAERAAEYARLETWYRDIGWTVIPQVVADRLRVLGLPGIEMRGGVMYGEHPSRGIIPFDALSPGQRIRLALQVALNGRDVSDGPAILPFDQEHWDALAPRPRAIMRYETKRAKVWLVTATARYLGELRVGEDVPADEQQVLDYIEQHGELPEAEEFTSVDLPTEPGQGKLF